MPTNVGVNSNRGRGDRAPTRTTGSQRGYQCQNSNAGPQKEEKEKVLKRSGSSSESLQEVRNTEPGSGAAAGTPLGQRGRRGEGV